MKKPLLLLLGLVLLAGCTGQEGEAGGQLSKALESNKPTLVMFHATWCAPCKKERPIIEDLEQKYAGELNVVYVDVDKDPQLASKYRVRGTPTMLFFNPQGEVAHVYVGFTPRAALEETATKLT